MCMSCDSTAAMAPASGIASAFPVSPGPFGTLAIVVSSSRELFEPLSTAGMHPRASGW